MWSLLTKVSVLVAVTSVIPGGIDRAATVDQPAVRGDVQYAPVERCDIGLVTDVGADLHDVDQLVLVTSDAFDDTSGALQIARRLGDTWICQLGTTVARLGRNGTRPLFERRSGDGTTPAGVFALGEVTAWDGQTLNAFGNRPDPGGHRLAYREVRSSDCWGATPNTADYQHLVNRPGCPGPDDEWLPRYGDVYRHAIVIGANLDPISGDEPGETPFAAAIFLHHHSYGANGTPQPTSGCVSIAAEPLLDALRLIDPALNPHFAIGPATWLPER